MGDVEELRGQCERTIDELFAGAIDPAIDPGTDVASIVRLTCPKRAKWKQRCCVLAAASLCHAPPCCTSDEMLVRLLVRLTARYLHVETSLLIRGMLQGTRQLCDYAHSVVEPLINAASLFKATRLVWMARLLQLEPQRNDPLPRAVLAYCLLYPLVDDLVDDPNESQARKASLLAALQRVRPNHPAAIEAVRETRGGLPAAWRTCLCIPA